MMDYEIRTLSVLVVPKDEHTFSDSATEIKIADKAAGEYLEVSQCVRTSLGKICISPEDWPTLRDAIDRMIKECR